MTKEEVIDLTGLKCPLPVLRTKKALASLARGDLLHIRLTDANAPDDLAAFCAHTGHEMVSSDFQGLPAANVEGSRDSAGSLTVFNVTIRRK